MCEQCNNDVPNFSRRSLFGLGLAATVAAATFPALPAWSKTTSPAPNAISPDEALKRLQEGNARYAANTSRNKDFSAGRAARASAQYPFASIVSCADSRLAPELAFDQGLGELFVVRVAGNFTNEDGLASLEYGSVVLGVPLILVLGHSNCGAVNATIKSVKEGTTLPGHLPSLINAIRPAVVAAEAKKPADLLAEATAENVRLNVKYLQTAKPLLADLVAAGKLKVAGAVYDIATGKITAV
ncbi:MAG: carbonic anhydrase [Pseudomonadota bacterium]